MLSNPALDHDEQISSAVLHPHLKPQRAEGLQITPFNSEGWRPKFIVKDREGKSYISTSEGGVALLELLNGQHTIEELRTILMTEHRMKFSLEKIVRFLDMCNQNNLLVDGSWLAVDPEVKKQVEKRRLGKRLGFYKQLIEVEGLLDWLMRHKSWWYNPASGVLLLLLLAVGFVFIAAPPEQGGLAAPLNQLQMDPADLYLSFLPLVFLIQISFHELAHSLSCRLFGARSGGFGFGLIWGVVPVFFTKTTDAYTIDNKYKRMMISAAGPMVDLAFLGLFGLIFWFAPDDSLTQRFALAYTAFPLSMLLVNLNPFLIRMDGYWILADFLELPNLRRSAVSYLNSTVRRWLRMEVKLDPLAERQTEDWRPRLIYSLYGLVAVSWTLIFVTLFIFSLVQSITALINRVNAGF